MVNSENASVPVRMSMVGRVVFRSMDHYVGVGSGVNGILRTPHVVCGVVNLKDLVVVNLIPVDTNGIVLLIGNMLGKGSASEVRE